MKHAAPRQGMHAGPWMCSTYSAVSAVSRSALNARGCAPLPFAKLIRSAEPFCSNTGRTSDATRMSAGSPLRASPQMASQLPLSFVAGSPVRTSQALATDAASMENAADCGVSLRASFASYDPATQSWRTCPTSAAADSVRYSETWPHSGMTRSGIAYRLPRLVPHMSATACGLWPTPDRGLAKSSGSRNLPGSRANVGVSLTDALMYGNSATCRNRVEASRVNPVWVEWLMGYPEGWSDLQPSVMQLCLSLPS